MLHANRIRKVDEGGTWLERAEAVLSTTRTPVTVRPQAWAALAAAYLGRGRGLGPVGFDGHGLQGAAGRIRPAIAKATLKIIGDIDRDGHGRLACLEFGAFRAPRTAPEGGKQPTGR
jgi:hypothetical protein